jgi:predicted DNA-binding transcriptional regulator YafY
MSALRQLLLESPAGVTLGEIAGALQLTKRSARRYLSAIRRDLEPLVERPGGPRRWRIPPVDVPRRVALRRTQAYALLAVLPLFEPLRGSALFEEIELAADGLRGIARRPGRGPNTGVAGTDLERRFLYAPFGPVSYAEQSDDLDAVFHGVADQVPVRWTYQGRGGAERMVAHPYALLLYKEALWILGRHTAARDVRAFELARVRDATCLDDEHFSIPADFHVGDFVHGLFGVAAPRRRRAHEVVIDFAPEVAAEVTSRRLHRTERFEPLAGGGVRLRLRLGDLGEVASWVMSFGPSARVVAPAELRERVRADLARAAGQYEDDAAQSNAVYGSPIEATSGSRTER